MPYTCALTLATTFCHSIRYALTPLFGPDFPDLCVPPESERFGKMVIGKEIVRGCTEEAERFRMLESRRGEEVFGDDEIGGDGEGEDGEVGGVGGIGGYKRRKLLPKVPKVGRVLRVKASDVESGYGTDTNTGSSTPSSPWDRATSSTINTPPISGWTCTNTNTTASSSSSAPSLFSHRTIRKKIKKRTRCGEGVPKAWLSSVPGTLKKKRGFEEYESSPSPSSSPSASSPAPSSPSLAGSLDAGGEVDIATVASEVNEDEEDGAGRDREVGWGVALSKEARAAWLLMQLHIADKGLSEPSSFSESPFEEGNGARNRKRRASS